MMVECDDAAMLVYAGNNVSPTPGSATRATHSKVTLADSAQQMSAASDSTKRPHAAGTCPPSRLRVAAKGTAAGSPWKPPRVLYPANSYATAASKS